MYPLATGCLAQGSKPSGDKRFLVSVSVKTSPEVHSVFSTRGTETLEMYKKVKFALKQAMKAQRESRLIALLFL